MLRAFLRICRGESKPCVLDIIHSPIFEHVCVADDAIPLSDSHAIPTIHRDQIILCGERQRNIPNQLKVIATSGNNAMSALVRLNSTQSNKIFPFGTPQTPFILLYVHTSANNSFTPLKAGAVRLKKLVPLSKSWV